MDFLPPILQAALVGLFFGMVLAIPVGPINLTIINEGTRRGFFWGALIGLGAACMETLYCFVAFTSLASFFTRGYVKTIMELCSFLFLLYLGLKFLMTKTVEARPVCLGARANRIELRIEEQLHPHSAFMTGFVRVLANVGVLISWVFLAAYFISHELVRPSWPDKCSCVGGVWLGNVVWFVCLSWLAALKQGRLSEKTLLKLDHFSGVSLLVLALLQAGNILWHLYK